MHNGSLYLLPFTQDPNGLFFHQFNGGSSGGRGSLHHESRFRCRATNAYGKIVSTVVSVKPGNNRCLTTGMNTCWRCIFPLFLTFLEGNDPKEENIGLFPQHCFPPFLWNLKSDFSHPLSLTYSFNMHREANRGNFRQPKSRVRGDAQCLKFPRNVSYIVE